MGGKLSGRVLVRRVAIRETVVKKLEMLRKRGGLSGEKGRKRSHTFSSRSSMQLLDQLTSLLQVRLEGSEKIVYTGSSNKATSFTKYRISVSIGGRRWVVSRRYSEFHNVNKVICS